MILPKNSDEKKDPTLHKLYQKITSQVKRCGIFFSLQKFVNSFQETYGTNLTNIVHKHELIRRDWMLENRQSAHLGYLVRWMRRKINKNSKT